MRSTADTTNRLNESSKSTFRNMIAFQVKKSEKSSTSKES